MSVSIPYLPGIPAEYPGPLARYLPEIHNGVISAWLNRYINPHADMREERWVLDPFGSSPYTDIEAAQQGFCVLVSILNPVIRLILQVLANTPTEPTLKSVIANLGATYKGSERLEPHLKGLYETNCFNCTQSIIADAFVWDREIKIPIKRIYSCPYCHSKGEFPTDQNDIENALKFSNSALHRARALERVAPLNDPDRDHAYATLDLYTDRALYAIVTLINKLESISFEDDQNLKSLFLSAFDRANNLWHYPVVRTRPRQLVTPSQFYEHNIWLSLEQSIIEWTTKEGSKPVPFTIWPEKPPKEGGICLYEGRFKDLIEQLSSQSMKFMGAFMVPPRPNQAFWAFSALWSGWLFGHENVKPMKSAFHRRRYDWGWHTNALHSVAKLLPVITNSKTPILQLISDPEQSFLTCAMISSTLATMDLSGISMRVDSDQAQIHWQTVKQKFPDQLNQPTLDIDQSLIEIIQKSAVEYLQIRAEPVNFNYLLATGLERIIHAGIPLVQDESTPADVYSRINQIIQKAFLDTTEFIRYNSSEHSLDVGLWWGNFQVKPNQTSLTDRTEIECVNLLLNHPGCTLRELDNSLCTSFPGLLTPSLRFIEACLQSYTEGPLNITGKLYLRTQDSPQNRRRDLEEIMSLLSDLGSTLSLNVNTMDDNHILWKDGRGNLYLAFTILTSAVFAPNVLPQSFPTRQHIIVVPGSRANLITYKLKRDPRLKQVQEEGLRFLKYRHLRRLASDNQLTRTKFTQQLSLDPLERLDPQMPLL